MTRVFLVDDSASARTLLCGRLREHGFDVVDLATAAEAAELAINAQPDIVVTDLWMPGISGLQLCRLLRSDPATAHVPVVLLTGSDDRRSRFWARHAGASAYVTKTEIDRLIEVLTTLDVAQAPVLAPRGRAPTSSRGNVQERLSQLLDTSLFETTIAGEVRALSQRAEEIEQLFEGLAALASEVAEYRWLALTIDETAQSGKVMPRLFLHSHSDQQEQSENEARDALALPIAPERRKPAERSVVVIADHRPVEASWSAAPILLPVLFGTTILGRIAISPIRRGASQDDRRFSALLANELGGPLRMAALVADARRIASTDTLTNLLNRRAFIERVERTRNGPEMERFPMSMLLLDLDHFKQVNDTLGHDAGDAVLQGVARVLSGMARKTDVVARWGGEEFVIALSRTAEAGARIAAERVRRAIAETPIPMANGTERRVSASIGLASAEGIGWELDELLNRADKAMYAAKHRGRNRVETA